MHGYSIVSNGDIIGEVTSGVFSPDLGISIGMGFVQKDYSSTVNSIQIDNRGRFSYAQIVKMPFYISN